MSTTIVLSTLFGAAVSFPLLKWCRQIDDNKIERLCTRRLFPVLLLGTVWSLFHLYSLGYAILLMTPHIFSLIMSYATYSDENKYMGALQFIGLSLLSTLVLIAPSFLFINQCHFYLERLKFPMSGLEIIILLQSLLVYFAGLVGGLRGVTLYKLKKWYGIQKWHVVRHNIVVFTVIAFLVSEGLLANSAIGGFLYRYPILYSWIGGKRVTPTLTVAVKDGDSKVRRRAASELVAIGEAETLIKIGGPAGSALVDAINDIRTPVRIVAEETLLKIGDSSAVPALEAADREFHSIENHQNFDCPFCRVLRKLGAK